MSAKTITILCVDDNTALAESLSVIIEAEADLKWLGHLHSAAGLLETARELCPQVLLLDIAMPGPPPFEALAEIVAAGLDVRTIVLSGYVDPSYIAQAIDAGAWGYVSKHDPPSTVIDAIRRVASGDVVLPVEALDVRDAK